MTTLDDLEKALAEGRKWRKGGTDAGRIAGEPPLEDAGSGTEQSAPPAARGDEGDGPAAPSEGRDRAQ